MNKEPVKTQKRSSVVVRSPTEKEPPKKKCGSKSASVTANCTATKDEISRIVMESFQYFNRKPVKTDEECAERLNDYFKQCSETGQIPTVEDMSLALGVTRWIVRDWEADVVRNPVRAHMIKKAKQILAGIDAKLVSEGKIPQVTYIFRAKNFFGMRDQQDVVLTPNTSPLGETQDVNALKKKYLENTYGISGELPEKAKLIDAQDSIEDPEKVLAIEAD